MTANAGDPVPPTVTEAVFRSALRGTVYPGAVVTAEPFDEASAWFQKVCTPDRDCNGGVECEPDCERMEAERVGKWRRLLEWGRTHPELHGAAYLGFEAGEFASVYPKFFVALTAAGSLVGVATCVVWT